MVVRNLFKTQTDDQFKHLNNEMKEESCFWNFHFSFYGMKVLALLQIFVKMNFSYAILNILYLFNISDLLSAVL